MDCWWHQLISKKLNKSLSRHYVARFYQALTWDARWHPRSLFGSFELSARYDLKHSKSESSNSEIKSSLFLVLRAIIRMEAWVECVSFGQCSIAHVMEELGIRNCSRLWLTHQWWDHGESWHSLSCHRNVLESARIKARWNSSRVYSNAHVLGEEHNYQERIHGKPRVIITDDYLSSRRKRCHARRLK